MTVLVTGVARGGTSMVAGVVRELGIDLGANLGPNHEDPQFLSSRARDIRRVVATRNAAKSIWGWKMPHAVDHLHRVEGRLRNPHVVVVFRNTLAVARSRMQRQGLDPADALATTLDHQAKVARAVRRTHAALLCVDYEAALADPGRLVDEVARFLHVEPTPEQRDAAVRMVDPHGGYRRVEREAWRSRVLEPTAHGGTHGLLATKRRRNVGFKAQEHRLVATAARPFIEFTADCERCVLVFEACEEGEIRVCVDVGGGFSLNMAERFAPPQGVNRLEITHGTIRGVRLFPGFGRSAGGAPAALGARANVRLVRLLVPQTNDPPVTGRSEAPSEP